MTMPPEALLLRRMEGLLFQVASTLRARAPWGALLRELIEGGEPVGAARRRACGVARRATASDCLNVRRGGPVRRHERVEPLAELHAQRPIGAVEWLAAGPVDEVRRLIGIALEVVELVLAGRLSLGIEVDRELSLRGRAARIRFG